MNQLELLEKESVQIFFKYKKDGFFIEVGANDPIHLSQTYHLAQLGWTGILIEPFETLYKKLVQQRPESKIFHAACSSPTKVGEAILYIPHPDHSGLSSLERNIDDLSVYYHYQEEVKVVTLDSILEQVNPKHIDFVSIDTEGTELDVLQGFNIKRYHPSLILLEDKINSLDKHFYLMSKGYKLVRRTDLNSWYIPKEANFEINFSEKCKLFRKFYLSLPFRKLKFWVKKIEKAFKNKSS